MTIFNVCTQRVAVVISGALLTLSFQALGAPAVSSVVINEGEQDRKRQISVFGNGFGSKAQPAPILVDHVDVAYENGVKNNVYADIDGSEVVVRSSDSNESLWEKSSLDMRVDSTRPKDTAPQHHITILKARTAFWVGQMPTVVIVTPRLIIASYTFPGGISPNSTRAPIGLLRRKAPTVIFRNLKRYL